MPSQSRPKTWATESCSASSVLPIAPFVTGALTAITIFQFIAPAQVLRMIFGEAPTDEGSLAVARHWGLFVFLVGALLIYAAFHASLRGPAMVVAAIEKAALGLGVFGTSLRTHPAAAADNHRLSVDACAIPRRH